MITKIREKIHPFYMPFRPLYSPIMKYFDKLKQQYKAFDVSTEKLLLGGNNGIRAAKYAEITKDFLMPSTHISQGAYVDLLNQFDNIGWKVLDNKIFKKTAYYQRALKCMQLTGQNFYDDPNKIVDLAKSFIEQYTGKNQINH